MADDEGAPGPGVEGTGSFWEDQLAWVSRDWLEDGDTAARLVTDIFNTLQQPLARRGQAAVTRTVAAAVAHEVFLRAFVAALARAERALGRWPPRSLVAVLRWSCIALPPLVARDGGGTAVITAVVDLQQSILHRLGALGTTGTRHAIAGARAMLSQWHVSAATLRAAVAHVTGGGEVPPPTAAAHLALLASFVCTERRPRREGRPRPKPKAPPPPPPPGTRPPYVESSDDRRDRLDRKRHDAAAAVVRAADRESRDRDLVDARAAALPCLMTATVAMLFRAEYPPPAAALLSSLAPLWRASSRDVLSAALLPAAARALRRSPEHAAPAVTAVFESLVGSPAGAVIASHALSSPELLSPLLGHARGAEEGQRRAAVGALRAIAQAAAGGEADATAPGMATSAVAAITALLGGSEGRLGQAYQRAGLYAALGALAASGPGAVGPAITACVAAVSDDTSDDGRAAALVALAAWLPHAARAGPTGASPLSAGVATFGHCLKDAKDVTRRSALAAIGPVALASSVARDTVVSAALLPLVEPLAAIAKAALPRLAARAEAASAAAAVASLAPLPGATAVAATTPAGAACAAAAALWPLVWSPDSALSSTVGAAAVAARLSGPELVPLGALAVATLARFGPASPCTPPKGAAAAPRAAMAACDWLLRLAAHQTPEARAAGLAAAAAARAAAGAVSPTALSSLDDLLLDAAERAVVEAEDAATTGVTSGMVVTTEATTADAAALAATAAASAPMRWGRAIAAVLPTPWTLAPPHLARWLLMTHSPAVAPPPRAALTAVIAAAGGLGGESPAPAMAFLLPTCIGPLGLSSPRPQRIVAASRAAAAVASTTPASLAALAHALSPALDPAPHRAITTDDVIVWRTPPGTLAADPAAGTYVATVTAPKNVRKARGRMRGAGGAFGGLDDMSDDDDDVLLPPPAPTHRPSQGGMTRGGAPAPATAKKDPRADARAAQMASEAVVRAHVSSLVSSTTAALGCLGAAAIAGRRSGASHDALASLSSAVIPLLSSPLVGDTAACDAVLHLASCAQPTGVARAAPAIAAALRLTSLGVSSPGEPPVSLRWALAAIAGACGIGGGSLHSPPSPTPLPPPTLALIFPLLQAAMALPPESPVCGVTRDAALSVLAAHVDPGYGRGMAPRPAMAALIRGALAATPARAAGLIHLLGDVCAGLSPHEAVDDDITTGLLEDDPAVRTAAAGALRRAKSALVVAASTPGPVSEFLPRLWISRHDPDAAVAAAATTLATDLEAHGGPGAAAVAAPVPYTSLLPYLAHPHSDVRLGAASALATGLAAAPEGLPHALAAVRAVYAVHAAPGLWPGRHGAALALTATARLLCATGGSESGSEAIAVAMFLAGTALGDGHEGVRAACVAAGVALVDAAGASGLHWLLPALEKQLGTGTGAAAEDRQRAGAVVLLGAAARHLPAGDPRVAAAVERLVVVLATPSEAVQREVAACLPPLMPALAVVVSPGGGGTPPSPESTPAGALVKRLLAMLLRSDAYGHRRGGAYGLAAAVKGLGISSLKAHGVMDALKAAVEDKADARAREGALLGFEALCERLGRLFEPYVIHILPLLLACYGDAAAAVREATEAAARAIMGQLSGQGVKLVLPALLAGLGDRAWRTKQGSVQLLGSMAYCAPKQLSACLPTVVPALTEVLSDTHPKVQSSAGEALQSVGGVVRNPEVLRLVPSLLGAITAPGERTHACLDTLLETVFVNTVDAPSLALIVPVLHRGLRERSTEVKKKAAKIVGNMCSLITDAKDMIPYVPLLLPELKKVLLDPIPEVRAIAAKAIASLIRGVGDASFRDVLPWLLDKLQSESSGAERAGAAQGLAEVLAALGTAHLEALLPDALVSCAHPRATVRDGHLRLLACLPAALGPTFQPYLGDVLPRILDGLADEAEPVRDAALAAGKAVVDRYAHTALPLLLPAVQAGLAADNWRIRQSSVELLGELLFRVAGATGKVQVDGGSDDEGASTEAQGRAVLEALGVERRDEVLAAVYVARSDVGISVRSASVHVWKTLVSNTPKMLMELLPALMRQVIAALAAAGPDRRAAAGRCLGELVKKLGERILAAILPILKEGLVSESSVTRQGVCFGLSEVLAAASRPQLSAYVVGLLPTVKSALCDRSPAVREAAGAVFSTLFRTAGPAAVEDIVPSLLKSIAAPEGDAGAAPALDALKQILRVQKAVLPAIVPLLVAPPLSAPKLRTLAALADVAGPALEQHLPILLPPLLAAMAAAADRATAPLLPEAVAAAAAVAAESTTDTTGGDAIADAALVAAESAVLACGDAGAVLGEHLIRSLADPATRVGAAHLSGLLCRTAPGDVASHLPSLITSLLVLYAEDDPRTLAAVSRAFSDATAAVPKDDLPRFIKPVRDALATAKDKERRKRRPVGAAVLGPGTAGSLPGLRAPKSLAPVLPILLAGVLAGGANDARESAADGLAELIDVAAEGAIRPSVVAIAGPLIRIVGDKLPGPAKAALLSALLGLVRKAGPSLKPFLPQLQTTFAKALHDGARSVRGRAAVALGLLMALSPRVDPLLAELLMSLKTSTDPGPREAVLAAIRGVLRHAGGSVTPPQLAKATSALGDVLSSDDDAARSGAARALGLSMARLPTEDLDALLATVAAPVSTTAPAWVLRQTHGLVLAAAVAPAGPKLAERADRLRRVGGFLLQLASCDGGAPAPAREIAARAAGRLAAHLARVWATTAAAQSCGDNPPLPAALVPLSSLLAPLLSDDASDVRLAAAGAIKRTAKALGGALSPLYPVIVPALLTALDDRVSPVRFAAERALMYALGLHLGTASPAAAEHVPAALVRKLERLPVTTGSDAEDEDDEDDGGGE